MELLEIPLLSSFFLKYEHHTVYIQKRSGPGNRMVKTGSHGQKPVHIIKAGSQGKNRFTW
jgi:hypothetical protein